MHLRCNCRAEKYRFDCSSERIQFGCEANKQTNERIPLNCTSIFCHEQTLLWCCCQCRHLWLQIQLVCAIRNIKFSVVIRASNDRICIHFVGCHSPIRSLCDFNCHCLVELLFYLISIQHIKFGMIYTFSLYATAVVVCHCCHIMFVVDSMYNFRFNEMRQLRWNDDRLDVLI